jgi:multiple antibiotic resistance protein
MLETLLNSFVVLFIVIDPIGIAPMFVAFCRRHDLQYMRTMAMRGVAVATGLLLVFFFFGDLLLVLLGVGLPAFRIAGGILFFLIAMDMVFARQSGLRSATHQELHEAEGREDISVFPLAFPTIAGPGAITTVLLMASSDYDTAMTIGMLAVLLAVLALALVSLLLAPHILRILGETGSNVVSRLLGLILAALAVQYVIDGIRNAFFTG